MPDERGNFTPSDIGQLLINGPMTVRNLREQEESRMKENLLFQHQIAGLKLEHRLKEYEVNRAKLLDEIYGSLKGLQGKGQPAPGEEAQTLSPAALVLARTLLGNNNVTNQPSDYSSPDMLRQHYSIAAGIDPNAGELLNYDIGLRNVGATMAGHRVAALDALGRNGGDLNKLNGDPLDPRQWAATTEGMTPLARLHAGAAVMTAQASLMNAFAEQELRHAESGVYTADVRSKYSKLHYLTDYSQRLIQQHTAAVNAGDQESQTQSLALLGKANAAVAQELQNLGYNVPDTPVTKDPSFFDKFLGAIGLGKKQPTGAQQGGIDLNNLPRDASGKIDLNAPIPGSPAPAAGLTAPTPNQPAPNVAPGPALPAQAGLPTVPTRPDGSIDTSAILSQLGLPGSPTTPAAATPPPTIAPTAPTQANTTGLPAAPYVPDQGPVDDSGAALPPRELSQEDFGIGLPKTTPAPFGPVSPRGVPTASGVPYDAAVALPAIDKFIDDNYSPYLAGWIKQLSPPAKYGMFIDYVKGKQKGKPPVPDSIKRLAGQ